MLIFQCLSVLRLQTHVFSLTSVQNCAFVTVSDTCTCKQRRLKETLGGNFNSPLFLVSIPPNQLIKSILLKVCPSMCLSVSLSSLSVYPCVCLSVCTSAANSVTFNKKKTYCCRIRYAYPPGAKNIRRHQRWKPCGLDLDRLTPDDSHRDTVIHILFVVISSLLFL